MNEALLEVIELTRGEALKGGVSVKTQIASGLPIITGDRVQLQQVVLNLILNALQAMGAVSESARQVLITKSRIESNDLYVGVQDTGPGLSPETLPRLFEPFHTTKPNGMGMGLTICRSIIESHGGRLWASACQPHGLSFSLRSLLDRHDQRIVCFWPTAAVPGISALAPLLMAKRTSYPALAFIVMALGHRPEPITAQGPIRADASSPRVVAPPYAPSIRRGPAAATFVLWLLRPQHALWRCRRISGLYPGISGMTSASAASDPNHPSNRAG
jgi:hypothetical protein